MILMDKWQALQSFWESFGIPAYDETTVPDNAVMPYITYNAVIDRLDHPTVMTASVWYRSNSWTEISQKAEEISDALIQVKTIPLDVGYLYLTRGNPFAQRMVDEDDTVRRMYIVLMTEYLAP